MPSQGPRPPRLFCASATGALALALGLAAAQDAPTPLEPAPLEPAPKEWAPPTAEPQPLDAAEQTSRNVEPSATLPLDAAAPEPLDSGVLEIPATNAPDESVPESASAPAEARAEAPRTATATDTTPATPTGVGNDDVLAMTEAKFSETTILAIIGANATRFDISPRALVALKSAGVSETVIEAMLTAESAKKRAADLALRAPVPEPEREPEPAQPSEEFVKLSSMIERLAAQQEAAEAARRAPTPPPSTDSSPRAWIVGPVDKTALAPTIAKVAFTDEKNGARFKTLQSLAGKALAFVNPAVSGIATTLGGLFRSDNERGTAVWALTGTSAARVIDARALFEIEFDHTPGVDPDRYQAAIVQLVRTTDNYRLVAAAKTEGTNTVVTARDPIVEEPVATQLTRLGRGRYRVQSKDALGPGEYALVLRPIVQKERKRKDSDSSLGELFGGGTSQILYLTWDFAVDAQ